MNISLRPLLSLGRYRLFRPLIRLRYKKSYPTLRKELFGLEFPNPVGLAAGFDTDGQYINQLGNMGFGFVEIGSVTPLPQSGNPGPRYHKLRRDKAVINNTGHDNKGVKEVIKNIKKARPGVIVAANIAKNSITEGDNITKDYSFVFAMLYDFVDMFVISQPEISYLEDIIDELLQIRLSLDAYKPIMIKISPDMGTNQIDEILDLVRLSGIDGLVVAGPTKKKEGLRTRNKRIESIGPGALSGAPLFQKNLELVKYINQETKGRLPIIASGGIMNPSDALQMLQAGASLVEIHSGLLYKGPKLVKKINKYLQQHNA